MSFHRRLAEARKKQGMNQTELAKAIGVSAQSVQQWEKDQGGTTPRSKRLDAISSVLKVSKEWLVFGTQAGNLLSEEEPIQYWADGDASEYDEVDVPFFGEVELSAGSGVTAVAEINKSPIRFNRQVFRNANVTPGAAVCCKVTGDSMEPILPDGATVGIDTHSTKIIDGKMYAFEHGGLLRVKFLQRLPGGGVLLRSANPAYEDDRVSPEDDFRILGRVFWSSAIWF